VAFKIFDSSQRTVDSNAQAGLLFLRSTESSRSNNQAKNKSSS